MISRRPGKAVLRHSANSSHSHRCNLARHERDDLSGHSVAVGVGYGDSAGDECSRLLFPTHRTTASTQLRPLFGFDVAGPQSHQRIAQLRSRRGWNLADRIRIQIANGSVVRKQFQQPHRRSTRFGNRPLDRLPRRRVPNLTATVTGQLDVAGRMPRINQSCERPRTTLPRVPTVSKCVLRSPLRTLADTHDSRATL